jgi:4-hydroxy-tetrahydrodipicolinate reductase
MTTIMRKATPIAMFGAGGRMGRMILELAVAQPERFQVVGAVDRPDHPLAGAPLSRLAPGGGDAVVLSAEPPACVPDGTVAIHFMLPEATLEHLPWSERLGVATEIGTTGLDSAQRARLAEAGRKIPILLTPNTSLGVNVLFWLARQAARLLGPDYDVEIVEMHHHHKKDAPSGTAKRLAEAILEERHRTWDRDVRHGRVGLVGERPPGEIGMHALRGGDVIGEHTVVLAGPGERVELTHRAQERELFARGALAVAEWLSGRPAGVYSMNDMLGL